jgi:hypothetical protein
MSCKDLWKCQSVFSQLIKRDFLELFSWVPVAHTYVLHLWKMFLILKIRSSHHGLGHYIFWRKKKFFCYNANKWIETIQILFIPMNIIFLHNWLYGSFQVIGSLLKNQRLPRACIANLLLSFNGYKISTKIVYSSGLVLFKLLVLW